MTLLAPDVPALAKLPLYDLPEATYTLWKELANSFGKVCLETASYCTVKSQSKKEVFNLFSKKG